MISRRYRLLVRLLELAGRHRAFASGEALRESLHDTRRVGPERPGWRLHRRLRIDRTTLDGHDVWRLRPRRTADTGMRLVYFHGGAYVRPITAWHWRFVADLVENSGCTAMVPMYPLAPAHDATTTIPFVREVWAACAAEAGRVVLAGDSAGAGLAAALCVALRDAGVRLPDHLLLLSPWLDVAVDHDSVARIAPHDPLLRAPGLREAGRWHAGPLALHHPWVSPLHADLTGFPPTTVYAGTRDILHADGTGFVDRLRQAGVRATLREGKEMIHVWPLLPVPEGRAARQEMATLLRHD